MEEFPPSRLPILLLGVVLPLEVILVVGVMLLLCVLLQGGTEFPCENKI